MESRAVTSAYSSVFIAGLGGLGCPALAFLAASGIPRIGAADFDVVAETNLHRQLLFSSSDIGRPKIDVARERIRMLPGASSVAFEFREEIVRGDESYLDGYDIVIDAADRADVKLALHDRLVAGGKIVIHAAATAWRGQGLTVDGPGCLRCLFGEGEVNDVPDCRSAGIVGPVVGLMGTLAASEALRLASGETARWHRRLFSLDCWEGRSKNVEFAPDPGCGICSQLRRTGR